LDDAKESSKEREKDVSVIKDSPAEGKDSISAGSSSSGTSVSVVSEVDGKTNASSVCASEGADRLPAVSDSSEASAPSSSAPSVTKPNTAGGKPPASNQPASQPADQSGEANSAAATSKSSSGSSETKSSDSNAPESATEKYAFTLCLYCDRMCSEQEISFKLYLMIRFFSFNLKRCLSPKTFVIGIIYSFSQFQSKAVEPNGTRICPEICPNGK